MNEKILHFELRLMFLENGDVTAEWMCTQPGCGVTLMSKPSNLINDLTHHVSTNHAIIWPPKDDEKKSRED